MNATPNNSLVCDFSGSSIRQEKFLLVDVISYNSFSWTAYLSFSRWVPNVKIKTLKIANSLKKVQDSKEPVF